MNTLDVAAVRWRKSTHSTNTGGDCVEVAGMSSVVAVRDSKNPDGPALSFAGPEFRSFAQEIRAGRYDL